MIRIRFRLSSEILLLHIMRLAKKGVAFFRGAVTRGTRVMIILSPPVTQCSPEANK
jgi:hypothetical protein